VGSFLEIIGWIVGIAAAVLFAGWLGLRMSRGVVRKYPSAASALWMLSVFLKFDPPPPPKAERVVRDDDAPGDLPKLRD